MVNYAGISALLSATLRPGLVVPHLTIPTINALSWSAAKSQGVRYVVFDKDNCLTKPHADALETSLEKSYQECLDTFGRDNVLIVSNSAGSSSDPGGVGAQHLSRQLYGTTVLCHPAKKPARACAKQVVDYVASLHGEEGSAQNNNTRHWRTLFASKPVQGSEGRATPHLAKTQLGDVLVIGDRIATDTVLSHRIADMLAKRFVSSSPSPSPPRAISILTTTLWANEGLLNNIMRSAEASIRTRLLKRGIRPGEGWARNETVRADDYSTLLLAQPSTSSSSSSSLSALRPSPPSPPTVTSLLVSSLHATRLPPVFKRAFSVILTSRIVARTLGFFKDGWWLILRGVREGLNRPEVVFGSATPRYRRESGSIGGGPRATTRARALRTSPPPPPRHRYYSTSSSSSSTPPPPRRIPLRNWLAAFTAIAIIPIGFYAGSYLHALIEGDKEGKVVEAAEKVVDDARHNKNIKAADHDGADTDADSATHLRIGSKTGGMSMNFAALDAYEREDIVAKRSQVSRELDEVSNRLAELRKRMEAKKQLRV